MTASPLLSIRGLSKAFPGVQALADVDLDIEAGTVHALMGENGAGKSTLMRVLAGLHPPDAGEIAVRGLPVRIRSPHHALTLGIAMIHQELMGFPDLSVAENLFMGREPAWAGGLWLDRPRMDREARALLARLGAPVDPSRPLRDLSVSQRQMVEIAQALAHRADLVIMDEPTSALSDPEVASLHAIVRDLARGGAAVIYISHRMDEVFRIADVVTVLRDGRRVGTRPARGLDARALIAMMVGRELADAPPRGPAAPGDTLLAVRGLGRAGEFADVSFDVRAGEIVGLAGLMGAGRSELLGALAGWAPAEAGSIEVRGRPVRIRSPRDAIRLGLAWVSEDRRELGLIPSMSVAGNLTLGSLRDCRVGPFLSRRREREIADGLVRDFAIRSPGLDRPVALLSGGNQQKVVMARVLRGRPEILLLDEPTRGVDVAAKAEIHALVARLAREGKAVLLVSSELPEVLALSDRLLVMREGRIVAELDPRRTTQEEVLRRAMPAGAAASETSTP